MNGSMFLRVPMGSEALRNKFGIASVIVKIVSKYIEEVYGEEFF